MPTTTTIQGIRVPLTTDDPDVVGDLTNAVLDIEKKLVMIFNSAADRNSKITVPVEGMLCYLKDTNTFHYCADGLGTWEPIIPDLPSFTSGNGLPSGGVDGDVHFRTEA